jgi:hypothetical protein
MAVSAITGGVIVVRLDALHARGMASVSRGAAESPTRRAADTDHLEVLLVLLGNCAAPLALRADSQQGSAAMSRTNDRC